MSINILKPLLLLTVAFVVFFVKTDAQIKECSKEIPFLIVKKIYQHYTGDSCYYHSTLMAIRFGAKAKIESIEFSDNAEVWLKEELVRVKEKEKIDYLKIEKIAKENKLKNVTMIFPMVFGSAYTCLKTEKFDYSICGNVDEFFKFNKKPIKGNIVICDTYTVYYGRPSH